MLHVHASAPLASVAVSQQNLPHKLALAIKLLKLSLFYASSLVISLFLSCIQPYRRKYWPLYKNAREVQGAMAMVKKGIHLASKLMSDAVINFDHVLQDPAEDNWDLSDRDDDDDWDSESSSDLDSSQQPLCWLPRV